MPNFFATKNTASTFTTGICLDNFICLYEHGFVIWTDAYMPVVTSLITATG